MSKQHARQGEIVTDHARADREVVAAFAEYPTTQIADCGGPVGVVGPGIHGMAGGSEFCGTAATLWAKPGDILYVLKAPDVVGEGDVLLIDGGGRLDAALIGDIVSGALSAKGCVGLVVDGAVRDVDGIDEVGLPTFARGAHPATGSNQGPGALNVPVQIGGVSVSPGDVVRGDRSGIVVIPRERAAEVLELTRAVDEREQGWRSQMEGGQSLTDVLGLDSLLAEQAPETPMP